MNNYSDFIKELNGAGFSLAGGNDEGIYGIIKFSWNEEPDDSPIRWHTEDPETDPWEWRMRVLEERDDIAYGKLFFNKGGFITKEWYPYFLAARRGGRDFDEEYAEGKISHFAKRIYEVVERSDSLALHEIKQLGMFSKEDKSRFNSALTELQMKMYITMCGRKNRFLGPGGQHWPSTVLCTTEKFFDEEVFRQAWSIDAKDAAEKIRLQILKLNPEAKEKRIGRFIRG